MEDLKKGLDGMGWDGMGWDGMRYFGGEVEVQNDR